MFGFKKKPAFGIAREDFIRDVKGIQTSQSFSAKVAAGQGGETRDPERLELDAVESRLSSYVLRTPKD